MNDDLSLFSFEHLRNFESSERVSLSLPLIKSDLFRVLMMKVRLRFINYWCIVFHYLLTDPFAGLRDFPSVSHFLHRVENETHEEAFLWCFSLHFMTNMKSEDHGNYLKINSDILLLFEFITFIICWTLNYFLQISSNFLHNIKARTTKILLKCSSTTTKFSKEKFPN